MTKLIVNDSDSRDPQTNSILASVPFQLYKSAGNFEKGKVLFDKYGEVTEDIQKWRDIVIARRQPRRLFVQPNTVLDGKLIKASVSNGTK